MGVTDSAPDTTPGSGDGNVGGGGATLDRVPHHLLLSFQCAAFEVFNVVALLKQLRVTNALREVRA